MMTGLTSAGKYPKNEFLSSTAIKKAGKFYNRRCFIFAV